jgi:ATP-dependent Lon protease
MITKEKQFIDSTQPIIHEHEDVQDQPTKLALLPLKNVVILPKSILPIIVGRTPSIKAVEHALKSNKTIFITAQKSPEIENPQEKDLFDFGTKAIILQVMKMPNNTLKILAEGICRSKIETIEKTEEDFYQVTTQDLSTTSLVKNIENQAIWRQIQELYDSYAKLNEKAPIELMSDIRTAEDMDCMTDTIAVHLNLSFDDRQEVLETLDLSDRMLKMASLLRKEIEILETEQIIKGRIQNQVEKNQREYYLNEQIKAIQKELGREDNSTEISKLREKCKSLKLTAEAKEKVEKELKRLEQMPPLSSEAVISKHYVDWIISLPWNKESKDTISLEKAEKILEKNHAGLKKAKERVIEFLAAKKYSGTSEKSPIICLIGPPGVGKTSLASAVAECLGREFVRISLGGIRDEAEIRGHRRTYIGALPGKIIHAMKKAKTVNPVILLDEIDKISKDIHGDPASALLEVLDPGQNKSFVDHFLEVEYDLSKVMFITTANMYETIPYPLLDRMELISLSGYTDNEKLDIAKKFLIPKKLKDFHLSNSQFKVNDKILELVISDYTKEAGVRQLERVISKLMRKAIQELLKNKNQKNVIVNEAKIKEWLGNTKFKKASLDSNKDSVGIVTGLAWTEVGGDVLEIETSIIPGKGNLSLTGQLGEVMQESAQAALTYIRDRADKLGVKSSFTSTKDIHLHLPEGATPKDGPSAGISMCTAVVSALTKNPVKPKIAMTGEITLRGRVLAVGGLKEKLLAAKRYGMETVIVPKENKDDIEEALNEMGGNQFNLKLFYAENMDEVLKIALEQNPFKKRRITKAKVSTKKTKKNN